MSRHALPLLCACAALAAHAEPTPYYVSARQDVSWQNNVYDAGGGGEVDDVLYTTSLRAGLDQPIGRQRVFAGVNVNHTRYGDERRLDNTGWGVNAGLDWETVGRLSGRVSASSFQSPTRLNVGFLPILRQRNLQRSDELAASVRFGGVGRLGLEAGAARREVSYSAPEFSFAEYASDSAHAGVRWRFSGALATSAGVRMMDTRYPGFTLFPGGPLIDDRAERRDAYVTATWVPTGASTLRARLNVGKNEFKRFTERDFSGVTGSLVWDWQATGKLRLQSTLARDTGQELSFPSLFNGDILADTNLSRVSTVGSVRATYALSGKVNAFAGVEHIRRQLVDLTGADSADRSTALDIGATWSATRVLALGCTLRHEQRNGEAAASDFKTRTLGCFGQVTLQL